VGARVPACATTPGRVAPGWDNPGVRYHDILDAIGNTPLVGMSRMSPKPGVRLWAKLEGTNPTGSTKDRIAKKMIEVAEFDGSLTPDKIILEPTSGNTGIALAMVAARKGYRLTVVIPDNASEERIGLLRLFGAEIVFSDGDKGTNGSIEVARALAADPKYFMPFQYGNLANPLAHQEGTAQEIIRDLPEISHFVAGMGTGGTLTGNGRGLHAYNPDIKVIAAEPELGDLVYGLRSLDAGFVPPIFDPAEVNRKFLVDSSNSLRTNRELTAKEGIFAGISSGAVVYVAQRIALEIEEGDIVCLLPDGGWKYLSTEAWAEDLATAEKGVAESLWW
jgi:cysteine synthase B